MSMRNGPNGETQLTPTPIARRGLGELPRNSSFTPAMRVKPVAGQVWVASPGRMMIGGGGAVVAVDWQTAMISVSSGDFSAHTEPTSTNADGRRPMLRIDELVGNSSSIRPM